MTHQPPRKSRPGRRPTTGKGVIIGTRLHPPFIQALDRYIAEHGGNLSRPGAIREILAAHFKIEQPKP